ncbi:MAG TPA: HAMP domain-containing sensor histidine kinase [Thermoanaerobaculia bacterium]|nr:HAMP domain-containing sensor histidine kinase [Thermoanaerobaculia bacterium]
MTKEAFAQHRAATTGLFCLFCLLAVALGLGGARPLSLAMGGSLLSLFLFTRAGLREALGDFLSPLAMVVDLALLFSAMSLTGGASSPYSLLLPAGLALAYFRLGRGAAWFFASASLLGVVALVLLGREPLTEPARLFPLLLSALAAPGLLAALEAARSTAAPKKEEDEGRAEVKSESAGRKPAPSAETAPAHERNREAEILHDLRSPLSVMRVYSDLIGESARRGEVPAAEHLANLAREIELAERLAGGPPAGKESAFAPGTQATADLVEILGSLATAYRLSLGGRRRIEFIAERPQLPVAAEPVALQRAFRNVLENAVKYSPDGGEIRIRAGAAGEHAYVVVKDSGIGMSPEERARAFDYAFRGTGAVASGAPGKGLGLAVSREILEANGGKISLTSEAGFGSEVTMLLPFPKGGR